MYRVVIIYAPAEDRMQKLVRDLEECFDRDNYKVKIKAADRSTVADLTAADLFLLGSLPEGGKAIHPDFSEILRALGGITLAGRVGGLFSVDSEPTIEIFRQAMKDCELVLSDQNFLNLEPDRLDPTVLRDWVAALTRQLEDRARGR
jgi:flavodoxin